MRQIIVIMIACSVWFFSDSEIRAQIVETPYGKAEVLGLRTWSLQRLLDTLSVKAPDKSIDKCAVDLKQIGFPDAAVRRYFSEKGKFYSVVTVIEPEYASFVKYNRASQNSEVSDFKRFTRPQKMGFPNHA
jgi:hypothetical protein